MIEDIIKPQKNVKNIIVSYSGGAESSLILYLLCKYYEKTDVKIIAYTISKFTADEDPNGWTPESVQAARVFQYIQNYTEQQPLHIIEYWNNYQQTQIMEKNNLKDPLEAKPIIEQDLGKRLLDLYDANVWYSGWSMMPSIGNMNTILSEYDKDMISTSVGWSDKHEPIRDIVMDFGYYTKVTPFAQTDKADVLSMYMKLGLFNQLYKKTISCPYHYGPCYNKCSDTLKTRTVAKSDCLERLYAERFNGVSQLKI